MFCFKKCVLLGVASSPRLAILSPPAILQVNDDCKK